jgi:histidinol-phosphate aminotransferase
VSAVALERYPDPRAVRLKDAIAKRTGARPADLLVGTGSDEVIAMVVNALGRPRARNTQAVILTPTPTFVMYRVTSRTHGQKPVEVPLDAAWDLDVATMSRAIEMMRPNVVFVASPNNPTGNAMSEDRLDAVFGACGPGKAGAFAVLDEAYADYAKGSLRGLRTKHPHLGILRTLSKIGLAALRVGWLEADEGLVTEIDKTRQPFNLSAVSQAAAAAVLEDDDAWAAIRAEVARIVAAREAVARELGALDGFSVTPSDANFLWVKTPMPAAEAFDRLVEDGILVRSFHKSGGRLSSQLRVTLGTERENERLVAAFAKLAKRGGSAK